MRVSGSLVLLCLSSCVLLISGLSSRSFSPCLVPDINCGGGTSLTIGGESICCPAGSGLNINENGASCVQTSDQPQQLGDAGTVGCVQNGNWTGFGACSATQCGSAGAQFRNCSGPFYGGSACEGSSMRPCIATGASCSNSTSSTSNSSSSSTGTNAGLGDGSGDPTIASFQFECQCSCCLGAGCTSTFVGSSRASTCDANSCEVSCGVAFPAQCPSATLGAPADPARGAAVTLCRVSAATTTAGSSVGITLIATIALAISLALQQALV